MLLQEEFHFKHETFFCEAPKELGSVQVTVVFLEINVCNKIENNIVEKIQGIYDIILHKCVSVWAQFIY